jgi:hypothetical protein
LIQSPHSDHLQTRLPGAPRLLGLVLTLACALAAVGWVKTATTQTPPAAFPVRTAFGLGSGEQSWRMNSFPAPVSRVAVDSDPISQSIPITTTPPVTNTLFFVQPGTPAAIPNFLQPAQGCAWAGIGGQVFDLDGQPVSGMMVRISGTWQGAPVSKFAVTNASQGFGPGGYDLYLGSQPQAASTLKLQLVDVAGEARSVPIPLKTVSDCTGNLLVVNLRERVVNTSLYYPVMRR